jgi:hypothetical protein
LGLQEPMGSFLRPLHLLLLVRLCQAVIPTAFVGDSRQCGDVAKVEVS